MSLFPVKPSRPVSAARQKLRATVARRAARSPSIEEDEEPTTSFKTALVVVLLLHVVAGGGIVMFNRIKTHRPPVVEAAPAKPSTKAATVAAAAQGTQTTVARPKPSAAPSADVVKKPVASAPMAAAASAEVKDSGAVYTVAKGDNPVAIARKLHVAYDDLLKLNKIDDPKKLRVGQKLHVPVKARASAN